MQGEFREALERLEAMCKQTMEEVRQLVELEASTMKPVSVVEDRVDTLENSSE